MGAKSTPGFVGIASLGLLRCTKPGFLCRVAPGDDGTRGRGTDLPVERNRNSGTGPGTGFCSGGPVSARPIRIAWSAPVARPGQTKGRPQAALSATRLRRYATSPAWSSLITVVSSKGPCCFQHCSNRIRAVGPAATSDVAALG